MEKEMSVSVWREVGRVLSILAAIGVFASLYTWVLIFASVHTREGNLILAVLTGIGLFAVAVSVKFINGSFGYVPVSSPSKYAGVMIAAGFIAIAGHIIGVLMPTPEEQSFFVFAPVVALGIAVAIWVARWLILGAKENKKDQL